MAYVVAARWRAKEGCEDKLAQVIAELIPLSRSEPACLFYQANRSIDDPRLFFLYEQYADEAGYRAHGESVSTSRASRTTTRSRSCSRTASGSSSKTFYDDRGGLAA